MGPRANSVTVLLTRRALQDIRDIEKYSVDRWGVEVAKRYVGDIEAALVRCSQHPGLLRARPEFSANLQFYVVNRHLLVCDVDEKTIVVLTVVNAQQDLLQRLPKLEPTLKDEIEILRQSAKRDDLESSSENDLHPDWTEETFRRLKDVESGVATPVPWSEVRKGLQDRSYKVS